MQPTHIIKGAVTAPAANAVLANVTALSNFPEINVGDWVTVTCTVYFDGTPASPNEDDNFAFKINGVQIAVLLIPGSVSASPVSYTFVVQVTTLAQVADIVCGANAGTAGATYHAQISLTKIDR